MIELTTFISYSVGVEIGAAKVKKYGYGTAIVTNCSKMEIYNSFAPLVPLCRTICVVLICRPKFRPFVGENEQVVTRKIMNINITFDHRFANIKEVSCLIKNMHYFFNHMDVLAYQTHE